MRLTRLPLMLGAVGLIMMACSDDNSTTTTGIPAGVEIFTATLTGPNERPAPVTSTATGTALITVMGNLVSWQVNVVGIDSIILGHIHKGVADSAGGVVVNFNPPPTGLAFSGVATTGSAVVADSVLVLMRAGRAYVNVHTKKNTGGEIRGQTIKVQ